MACKVLALKYCHVPAYGGAATLLSRVRRRRRVSRGQALAEFAIVLPVLLLVVGGIIQFGILFWGQNTLTQVTRDTGRWASTEQTCSAPNVVIEANNIAAQSSLIGYSSWSLGTNVDVQYDGTPCPPTSNAQVVWVTITIHHHVPILLPWVPGNGDLTSSAKFRMEPMSQP